MASQLTARALRTFQTRMLAWFRAHQRDLPWRRSRDPYRIWVAEVMLQQTRITAVMPYYHRFLARFPAMQSLARAPESEVLKLWSGLGYYSRARKTLSPPRSGPPRIFCFSIPCKITRACRLFFLQLPL